MNERDLLVSQSRVMLRVLANVRRRLQRARAGRQLPPVLILDRVTLMIPPERQHVAHAREIFDALVAAARPELTARSVVTSFAGLARTIRERSSGRTGCLTSSV